MPRMNLRLKPAMKDLIFIIIGTAGLTITLAVTKFHIIDRFIAFYQAFTYAWELEELIVISLFLALSFAIFAWRRWKEFRMEVAERSRLEGELGESHRTLATLMSNVPGMPYRCQNDRDRTMEFVGDFSSELTGYDPPQLIRNNHVCYGKSSAPKINN